MDDPLLANFLFQNFPSEPGFAGIAAALLTLLGAICVFKPGVVQGWFQARYHQSGKFAQNLPFSTLIFRPWYRTYLRLWGAWAWVFALIFGYAAFAGLACR